MLDCLYQLQTVMSIDNKAFSCYNFIYVKTRYLIPGIFTLNGSTYWFIKKAGKTHEKRPVIEKLIDNTFVIKLYKMYY